MKIYYNERINPTLYIYMQKKGNGKFIEKQNLMILKMSINGLHPI